MIEAAIGRVRVTISTSGKNSGIGAVNVTVLNSVGVVLSVIVYCVLFCRTPPKNTCIESACSIGLVPGGAAGISSSRTPPPAA
jgi:hypothetical protein